MTIAFPSITSTIIESQDIVNNAPQRVLLVGQKLSGGTAVAGQLVENIQNDGSENTLFGQGSMLAAMVRKFKAKNNVSRLDAIPLADHGSGVASTRTITFATTATASGVITFWVASYDYKFELAVTANDNVTTIAGNLVTLINAQPKCQFTAANVAGVVTLTAANKGVEANYIGLALIDMGTVTGTTVTIANVGGGATNPTLTTVFDPIENIRYQTIVWPSSYTLSVLSNYLDSVFNTPLRIMDGVGIYTLVDTFANGVIFGNGLNTKSINSYLTIPASASGVRYSNDIDEVPNLQSASIAAIRALRRTQGVSLRNYVYGSIADKTGGAHISSLPYANTPYYDLPVIDNDELLTIEEIAELNDAGVSKLSNNQSNDLLISGQAMTTYKRDSAGNASITYKYLNYVDTISACREYFSNNLQQNYKQYRLTEGDIGDSNEANAASIAAFIQGLYSNLEDLNLVQRGATAQSFFEDNLTVTVDLATGTASVFMKLSIVTQLRNLIVDIEIAFTIS